MVPTQSPTGTSVRERVEALIREAGYANVLGAMAAIAHDDAPEPLHEDCPLHILKFTCESLKSVVGGRK